MSSSLASPIKKYISNYRGISQHCWQGIFLTFINDASACIIFFLSLYFVNSLSINISASGTIISSYGHRIYCAYHCWTFRL